MCVFVVCVRACLLCGRIVGCPSHRFVHGCVRVSFGAHVAVCPILEHDISALDMATGGCIHESSVSLGSRQVNISTVLEESNHNIQMSLSIFHKISPYRRHPRAPTRLQKRRDAHLFLHRSVQRGDASVVAVTSVSMSREVAAIGAFILTVLDIASSLRAPTP